MIYLFLLYKFLSIIKGVTPHSIEVFYFADGKIKKDTYDIG